MKKKILDIYPLSPTQEGMLFHYLMDEESDSYYEQLSLRIRGELKIDLMERSWNLVIENHDVLRTLFTWDKSDQPLQVVVNHNPLSVDYHDLSSLKEAEWDEVLERIEIEDRKQGFDLKKGPLMRVIIVKLTDELHEMILSNHHILMDGWCGGIIFSELFQAYSQLNIGMEPGLKPKPRFKNYIQYLQNQDKAKASEFWREYLEGFNEPNSLVIDDQSEEAVTGSGQISVDFSPEVTTKLTDLARQLEVTVSIIAEAVWGVVLARYNNCDDVVFGTTVSGRPADLAGVEEMVGLFINTVPTRVRLRSGLTGQELLKEMHNGSVQRKEFETFPLVDIQRGSAVIGTTNLFESIFVFENFPVNQLTEDLDIGLEIIGYSSFQTTNYPLNLIAGIIECLHINFIYDMKRCSKPKIQRLIKHYQNVLEDLVNNPDKAVTDLRMLSVDEEYQLIEEFNQTESDYPADLTVQQLFEEQVAKNPQRLALKFGEEMLTYAELNEQANQLAYYLRDYGVVAKTMVGLIMERSLKMIISLVAIIKAGGAYVPIDPDYPEERIEFMLKDCDTGLLCIQERLLSKVPTNYPGQVIIVDDLEQLSTKPKTNPEILTTAQSLAYVIYTSGSTGKPKGTLIEQRSINRLILNTNYIDIQEDDRILQLSTYCFDAITFELWGALLNGALLVLISKEDLLSPDILVRVFEREQITISFITSALFNSIADLNPDAFRNSRRILVGGDRVSVPHVRKVFEYVQGGVLSNNYGPTENTTFTTSYQIYDLPLNRDTIPIGKPISNTKTYVLDDNLRPVTIGVAGELYIGGDGLSRGYLNRPELTTQKFINHPFIPGEKLYRTGDLVKYQADGNIEFIGRIDNQVKIRGFRIEPGEIETVLLSHPEVQQVVVIPKSQVNDHTGSELYLVVYYVAERELTVSTIRHYLKDKLPEYMIPGIYIPLTEMPLNANGKIDRGALPEPQEFRNTGVQYVEPTNELETQMVEVWKEVLGVQQVGTQDNFFDLGGDSIKAIQLVARMGKVGVKSKVKDIFTYQTIEQIALHLDDHQGEVKASQSLVQGEQSMLPIQHWFFAEEFADIHHWNLSVLLKARERLDRKLLTLALQELIIHHDVLRINLQADSKSMYYENRYVQQQFEITSFDLSGLTPTFQLERIFELGTEINASMFLNKGVLLKAAVFDLGQGEELLLLAVHHLVVDGFSWRILLEDLITGYSQLQEQKKISLPLKTTSLQEWAKGLLEYSESAVALAELAFWQQVVADFTPLPLDPISDDVTSAMGLIRGRLSKEETEFLLKNCHGLYNTEMNDLLLTALIRTIKSWIHRDQITVLLEGHGREEIIPNVDITRTVGWFTTLYPVKLDIAKSRDLRDQIITIKEQLRGIPKKGIGYGILKYLTNVPELQADLGKETITFNYLGELDQSLAYGPFTLSTEQAGWDVNPMNHRFSRLGLNGLISRGQLELVLNYDLAEYLSETVHMIMESYLKNLREIIKHCQETSTGTYTPADFLLVQLGQDYLEKINKEEVLDIYPLAPLQEGMLYHYVVGEAKTENYIQQMYLRISGKLDLELYRQAWEQVFRDNDVFRTLYRWTELEKPVQVVYKHLPLCFEIQDLSQSKGAELQSELAQIRQSERRNQLNLAAGPTMKVTVCKLGEENYEIIWTYHHILIDGWCVGIIMRQLFTAYRDLETGSQLLRGQHYRYRDYIAWLSKREPARLKEFWKSYLQGFATPSTLPYDYQPKSSSVDQLPTYANQQWIISEEFMTGIEHLVKQYKITVNTLFQTVWGLLLQVYNNTNDVVFGATVSGRPADLPGVEEIVGLFINTIPIRVKTDWELELREALEQIHQQAVEKKEFENSALPEIKAQSEITGQTQLFTTLLVFENYPIDESLRAMNSEFQIEDVDSFYVTNYDLTLVAMHHGRKIELSFQYNTDLFASKTIERMLHQFQLVLGQMINTPNTLIKDLSLLTQSEKEKLLVEFNQTLVPCLEQTLQAIFEDQVREYPERIALVFGEEEVTYLELNRRANQLARVLRRKGAGPDLLVGMIMERSVEMIVGILAILKAGGAYVPIRPDYPEERIHFMLEDSRVPILLIQSHLGNLIPYSYQGEVISVDEPYWDEELDSNLDHLSTPANLAYVIYTSGTTGEPKGVMIEHLSVVRLFKSEPYNYDFTEDDVWTMFHSYCFDFSVWEMYGALLFGGKLVIVSTEDSVDTNRFLELCKKHQVTVLNQTPAAFYNFIEAELNVIDHTLHEHLRYVIFGGEALNFSKLIPWVELYDLQQIALINMYGITETTVHVTYERIEYEDLYIGYRSLVGKPIYNTTIYLLGQFLRPVPTGVVGEMYVGGIGVARGYLNRKELTAEKFVPHPFSSGEYLYRSGDLGRFTVDGNLEYLGRIDQQVKIRGFRIELGEIETALLKHPEIQKAVVIDRSDEHGNKYLAGYYVAAQEFTVSEFRQFLQQTLPDYIIPLVYVKLQEIPLTGNGKVNRKALPEPKRVLQVSEEYVAPVTELESRIAEIWADVLGVERIGLDDNFYDLGGDSIKAIQVVARMNKHEIYCQVKDIFTYQTIGQVALHVSVGQTGVLAEQGVLQGEFPLNPVQSWFVAENFLEANHWNQSVLLRIKQKLNRDVLQKTFTELLRQHDGLRVNYLADKATLIYRSEYLSEPFVIEYYDLSNLTSSEQLTRLEELGSSLKASFDLEKSLLIKVAVFELGRGEERLLITLHHLVVDGISWRIIIEDLYEIYQSLLNDRTPEMPAKTSSLRDWVNSLYGYSESEELLAEVSYWEKVTTTYQPLAVDRLSGRSTLETAGAVTDYLTHEETDLLLTKAHEAFNTEMNDLLLTALLKTLKSWTGEESVMIHLEGHGREEIESEDIALKVDLSRTVGWFTSIYPVTLSLKGCNDLAQEIKSLKEQLRKIPHKGIGYGVLKYLTKHPHLKDKPEADIIFNYLGQFGQEMDNDLFSLATENTGIDAGRKNHRPHLLDINCIVVERRLRVVCSYCTNRYYQKTIERLVSNYLNNLREIISYCTESGNKGFTTSDFELVDLDQEEIDALFG